MDNPKAEKRPLFKTKTNIQDGCIFDKTSELYKDSRYVSLNVRINNDVVKTDLFQVEKENYVQQILNTVPAYVEAQQEKKKSVEVSFWARPVLKYDGAKCGTEVDRMSKDEVVKTIKKNRNIMKESDFSV